MKWEPVESSVFTEFSYVRREHVLYLRFYSGEVYRYFDFPPDQFGDFLAAESKGKYFAYNIRDRFPFERVRRRPSGDDDGPKGKRPADGSNGPKRNVGRRRCRHRRRSSDTQ